MAEYTPRRLKSAAIKARQLEETGADFVVTSCHNCVDGLTDLIRHYKLGMGVSQLVNLVANAIVVPAQVAVPEAVEEVPKEAVAEEQALQGYKILVVDDEPDILVYYTALLEDNGARVFEAPDGDKALALARSEKPDLITLDLEMPEEWGPRLYRKIVQEDENKNIPVIVISGLAGS